MDIMDRHLSLKFAINLVGVLQDKEFYRWKTTPMP